MCRVIFKKICTLLAALCLTLPQTWVWASGETYACTEVEYPEELNYMRLMVQKDGSLDAFRCEVGGGNWEDGNGTVGDPYEEVTVRFLHSSDGGKTWRPRGTSWLETCYQEYAEGSYTFYPSIIIWSDGDGDFYFMADSGVGSYKTIIGEFSITRLYRVSEGRAVQLASFEEQQANGMDHFAVIGCGGDTIRLAVSHKGAEDTFEKWGYMLLDAATGEIKTQEFFGRALGLYPMAYADGRIYGVNNVFHFSNFDEVVGREPDKCLWLSYDTAAQKEVLRIDNPFDIRAVRDDKEKDPYLSRTVTDDGTYYATSRDGIFRLKPGETSFTKIMNAEEAHFQQPDREVSQIIPGYHDDLYIITQYYNGKDWDDPKNGTEKKLLHYVPQ